MKVLATSVLLALTGASSTLASDLQCEPESTLLLKVSLTGQFRDEFGAFETVQLRAVCRDRRMLHVETYSRPIDPMNGAVLEGKMRVDHYRKLLSDMNAIRIGVMTGCAVDEPFDGEFSAQITWLGRNGRSNRFAIVRSEHPAYRPCSPAETAFAATAFGLGFESAEYITFP
jgi:hypothetical protein